MITVTELADQLGVDPGDVRVLLGRMGEHSEAVEAEFAAQVRDDLDQFGVRSVPALWWPGLDPDAGSGATKMR